MKILLIVTIALCACSNVQSQKNWVDYFDLKYTSLCTSESTYREYYLQLSASGDQYDFMRLNNMVAPLMNMYVATQNEEYLNDEIKIINNVLSTAAVTKSIPGNKYKLKDDYLGWICRTLGSTYYSEAELYEGYLFRYITQFLYEIKKTGWKDRSDRNRDWYNSTLQFIEKNIWEKWISRSMRSSAVPYATFLGSRTHMGSHWAHVGLFLKELTDKAEIKTQCQDVVNMFDLLLKRNLKYNTEFPDAYTWNSTWDDVQGAQAQAASPSTIQDVSHGNHVIAYIVVAKRYNNPNWTDANILAFCNTVKQVMFQQSTVTFTDNVDGTASTSRPGWGNSQCEGWVQLGLFDDQTRNIYVDFALRRQDLIQSYTQEMEYYANLALIEHLRNS
ncbi:MAG TPA: hypothetical protein PK110_12810 [Niabella sp.]|uniref:hypothetical protein n=1 Tax=Agriterribacter sp. TaxID=2821509 RepID=UPI002BA0F0FD|nr:hypothetical protein [Agriterribacter sp.]HRO85698.1 hypothetical protein [Niabella sp.]HRP54761.1 hypothetical protein [Agriterribacter sp.]